MCGMRRCGTLISCVGVMSFTFIIRFRKMLTIFVSSLAVGAVLFFIFFYFYRRFFPHQIFRKQGIPGPTPNWLLGNAADFADPTCRHLVIPRWTKTYGKLFGYYEGSRPTLVTSDVDFVTQVFIKQFPKFHGRKLIPIQANPDTSKDPVTMLFARGERWKRLRTIVNPAFSSAKLRSLMPLVLKCNQDFMALIDRKIHDDEDMNIFHCFQLLTLDTISEAAFGIELSSTRMDGNSTKNPLLHTINEMFEQLLHTPLSFQLAIIAPELTEIFRQLELFRAKWFGGDIIELRDVLVKMIDKIIEMRKSTSINRQDLLQIMLEMEESRLKTINGHKALSTAEISGQSMLFMIAGYETSSNTLAFTAFNLANHPDVQEKVIAEIDSKLSSATSVIDYDFVQDLPYMDCVINETIRLFPVAPLFMNRLAMEDTEVNGIFIPKGMSILADVWSLHRDEEQWGPVDPNQFYPERFMSDYPSQPTRSDAAFLGFGIGPRKCIGARFALLEMKLALVNLLRKYRIEKTPRTGETLKLQAAFTIMAADGVWVKLSKR